MTKVKVGFVFVIVLALAVVSLHAQQGVAGTWSLSVPGMSMPMVLAQDGDRVTGTIESPHGVIQLKEEFSKGKLTLAGAPTDQQRTCYNNVVRCGSTMTCAGGNWQWRVL